MKLVNGDSERITKLIKIKYLIKFNHFQKNLCSWICKAKYD